MESDPFAESIIRNTGEDWEILGLKDIRKEISFIWKLFLNRKRYDKIVFWQQRHGIYYANLCNLFHVKKAPKAYILTFIYKKDNGIKGALKAFLYKKTVESKCITNIVCYSEHEVGYYSSLFLAPKGKIISTTFGLKDEKYRNGKEVDDNDGYILDVGFSNRDHDFLIEALADSEYKAIIADSTFNKSGNNNCTVRHDIKYGESLYSIIEKSFVVIVPLIDMNISAGQTVFIQAMMFSKPIIATESNAIQEYVVPGENGFIIKKNKDDLIKCLDLLKNDNELYEKMCKRSREMFEERYSFDALGTNISNII